MAGENEVFAQLGIEPMIIDQRANQRDLIEGTVEKIKAATKTDNVQKPMCASIGIIKAEDQCSGAVVIAVHHHDRSFYFVVPADPYNLLKLAHKIQEELDPSKNSPST